MVARDFVDGFKDQSQKGTLDDIHCLFFPVGGLA